MDLEGLITSTHPPLYRPAFRRAAVVESAAWEVKIVGEVKAPLRIMPSWVREGLGPSPLKYSKNVASLPEHSVTVRTLWPEKRCNCSKLRAFWGVRS